MDGSKYFGYADLEWAVGINRFTLEIIGLWPDERQNHRQKFLANLRTFSIFITLILVSVIPGILSLIRVWGDMVAILDNLQISLPFTVAVMKIAIMWLRKKELTPIVSMVVTDWIKMKTMEERKIMIRQAGIARKLVMFGCMMMVIAIVIIVVPPFFGYSMRYLTNITDPGKPLLLQTYYLRDITKSPYFEIVFVAQTVAVTFGAFSYTGIDNFLGLIIFHICAQMEILRRRLLDLHGDFNASLPTNVRDHVRLIRLSEFSQSFHECANRCVNKLSMLILLPFFELSNLFLLVARERRTSELFSCIRALRHLKDANKKNLFNDRRSVDVIEDTFNLMLLALLAYFAVLFCLQGFLIINLIDGGDSVSFMRICWLVSVLVNTFVHMCLYCVVGEILLSKCEGIYHAAYDYSWYSLKPREARNLMLIMIRADKPLYITAGKIFPMTLSMFCSLIKTSAGYMSVLLANR